MLTLADHLARVAARKAELGVVETPELTEAMRNPGDRRTAAKRALLEAAAERARAAGRDIVPSRF